MDDHPALRSVIRRACEELAGLEVVGESSDGPDALRTCASTHPDVVVLDVQLPGLSGLEVISRLRANGSEPRILVLSEREDTAALFDAIRLGADGYLEKTSSARDIAAAVSAIAAGEQVFTTDHRRVALAELGLRARRSREAARTAAALSPREREILSLIAAGMTNRQIASRLSISTRTVESHVGSLYRKLGVGSRIKVVQVASRLSLVPPDHGDGGEPTPSP